MHAVRVLRTAVAAALAAGLATTALAVPAMAAMAAPTAQSAPAARPAPAAHAATQQALDKAVAEGVPGALAAARDGKGRWSGAAGERGADDRFRVGSITKTFTATVLLQLQAEGRLDLDDTVEKWLPGVVRGHGNDGRKVTVRRLLNHTSGIYSYTNDPAFQTMVFGPEFMENRYDTWTNEQLVGVAMSHRPDFAPGTSWTYSNTNFVLAGMIIEKVTGRSYEEEVGRRIIKPLGLRATRAPGTDPRMPRPHSGAYSKLARTTDGPTYEVGELNPSIAGAAGEIVSDAGDLQTFVRALLTGRLLPSAALKEMKDTVATDMGPEVRYGLGIIRQELSCGTVVWGHSGGIHGSTSEARVTEDGRHSLAANFNADWTGDIGAPVEAEFCGTNAKPDKTAKTAKAAKAAMADSLAAFGVKN
ncbi:serine hydrolase domain-containing protein [Streptomyces laurentii]|uniref:serine hydrolase domain-containing protein n=1 Tax=Streptomyces laurentii TaxID=39478 RepID=UPI003688A43B